MIPAAAYLRVSSDIQVEQGSSLPSQLAAITDFAAKNGFSIAKEHIFKDEGISARSDDRPDFQRMVAYAKLPRPPFQAIICYESSRFARNREDAIIYKSLLRRRGIQVRFCKQDFDDSPMGKLMEGMTEIIDEWYSANFAIETRRGQVQNAKDGYSTGGRPPYGLRIGKVQNEHGKIKSIWEPDPEKSIIVRRIYDEYAAGRGYNVISESLNRDAIPSPNGGQWNKNTLHYILHKNQLAYLGCLVYGREKPRDRQGTGKYNKPEDWIINEGAWEAIITKDMAEAAELRKKKNRTRSRTTTSDATPRFLLTGKIFCGLCGSAMVGSQSAKLHHYYRCNTRTLKGKDACSAPMAGVIKIETAVIEAIKDNLCCEDFLQAVYNDGISRIRHSASTSDIDKIKKNMENIAEKRKRLVEAVANGHIPASDVKAMLENLQNENDVFENKLLEIQYYTEATAAAEPSFKDFSEVVDKVLNIGTRAAHKVLIDAFVEKVTVFPDHIDIIFTIAPPPEKERKKKVDSLPSSPPADTTQGNLLCREVAENLLRQ